MIKNIFVIAFIAILALAISNCQNSYPSELKIVDAKTQQPIEGALVRAAYDNYYFRSDHHGHVRFPADFSDKKVEIRAKNYRTMESELSNARQSIALQLIDSLVSPVERQMIFTRADTLRGSYGKWRENNDLLYYDLNIKVDVENKFISGWNSIRFKMLTSDNRIQIDLFDNMTIDSIMFSGHPLNHAREFNAVFIDFPEKLNQGQSYAIDFYYSGNPRENGRFGGLAFKEDSLGNPWIFTACQGIGASLWWPNKDQQRDEVDSMRMRISVPSELTDVSNGRFMGKTDLADGYTRFDWVIHYPINNYSVSLNIGKYVHFAEKLGDLTLDYYVLPYHLKQAKRQFAQAKPMLECFESKFGHYPFPKDGFKLIEVPYSGMEHQSAVTYGNQFKNGYLGRDWTGVGVSTKFDFIIIHESGHEWFGNSVTCNDVSDAWIQEGWCTYTEVVYAECMFGYEDAIKYVNGYQEKVRNDKPIIGPTGVNKWPGGDQYFKGALFMNTLRHVVNDDQRWWQLIRDYADHFQYRNIWTSDVINFFNEQLDRDLRPVFEQYLYYSEIPVLQVKFGEDVVAYRWKVDVADFDMPVAVRVKGEQRIIEPTTQWQTSSLNGIAAHDWQVAEELFYIAVERN